MLNNHLKKLKECEDKNLTRTPITIKNIDKAQATLNNQSVTSFANNDYLGLAQDIKIKEAFKLAVDTYGLGSGSSAIVSGYYAPHQELETRFAQFLERDRAILFNSGYHANLALLTVFADKKNHIIADKLCHASIIDAMQLSKADFCRFQHNNIEHCELRLKNCDKSPLIITEGVFSMEGDIAPLNQLAALSQQYNGCLIVDDAHGIGVLGKSGRGTLEHYDLSQEQVPILNTPLGKALGSLGAIVSGPKIFIDALRQFARTYHYTTALPPALVQASLKSLELIQQDGWRRAKLNNNILFFNQEAKRLGLTLLSNAITPIRSIVINDNGIIMKLQQQLMNKGFWVSAIRSPTVPIGTERLRISINCLHTFNQITALLETLYKSRCEIT